MGSILEFVFGFLGDAVAAEAGRDHLAEFDCSLRVIAGSQDGLGDGWREGQATVYPGGLEFVDSFHPKGLLRADWVPAPPISLQVVAVVTARQHQPNDQATGKVNANSQIVELTTDTATLEWALPTDGLSSALEYLQSSWPSEVPPA
jgi:hypothetical protein